MNRRFRNSFSFGLNYTYGISFKGNTGLTEAATSTRPDGTLSVRADQAAYEKQNENLDRRPHTLKANACVEPAESAGQPGRYRADTILNDWQLAGVLTAGSGAAYDLVFNGSTYQSNGQAVNLTGSPNYNPKLVING